MMSSDRFKITSRELIASYLLISYLGICLFVKNHMMINWLGVFIYVYCVYTWKVKTSASLFSPYFILMTFLVLFNYGQPIMWAFDIHKSTEIGTKVLFYGSGYMPNEADLIEVQLYICLGMLIFHLGAMAFTKRKVGNISCVISNVDEDYGCVSTEIAMLSISRVLLVITTPIAIYSAARNLIIARVYGYNALYYGSYATQSGYIQIILYFFYPALIGYLIGKRYSKGSRRIAFSIFGIYAVINLLSGDRGSWLYSLVILFWLHTYYTKTSIKKYVKVLIIGVVGLYFLSAITSVRDNGATLSLIDFKSIFSTEGSPIVDAFFELGGSMGIITYLFHSGYSIYPYANTYITSILGVVSSRVLSLFGLKQVLIADWFSQEYLGISWGTGFSMIGEAYINGGYYGGLIYLFIIGCIHGKVLDMFIDTDGTYSPLKLFITVTSLDILAGFSRAATYLVLKELFYGVIVVSILIKMIVHRK